MTTVNVANRSNAAFHCVGTTAPPGQQPVAYHIAGNRAETAVDGWGISYDIDQAVYSDWLARHPDLGDYLKIVTEADIDAMRAAETDPARYGHEVGLAPPDPTEPASEPTPAVLTGGSLSDAELAGLIADLDANGSAWLGFDIAVDGALHTVRQQFGGVASAYDVCTLINARLGPYAVTTMPGEAAPWAFIITSNTTGAGSTISYASDPSALADIADDDPRKKTTAIGDSMRLTELTGAAIVQGADAARQRVG